MGKISRYGGPTSIDAQPGEVIEDGLGRFSALHPEEQEAFPLHGNGDENAWLKRDDDAADGVARDDDGVPERGKQGERVERSEDVSPGTSSSRSDGKPPSSDETTSDGGRQPARTTANRSK